MKQLTLRARLSAAFVLAVLSALLCFAAAATAVLWLDAKADQRAHPDLAADDMEDVWKAVDAMLAVSPLVIAAAAGLGGLLAKRAVAPMREASRRARLAHANGTALELPRTGKGPEWDELADTLNALLSDARASYERIQRFTADAAHELRNPLTAILGESEVALRDPTLAKAHVGPWRAVREEGERLRRLLEGLLSLARADAGQLLRSREEVDLDALATELVQGFRRDSGAGARMLAVRGVAGAVEADPTLIRRAIENLLDNALRHATSSVTVSLARAAGAVRIQVADDGPGVPNALRERIFERFFRVDPSAEAKGFGLGLPIARAIALAHGGTLQCLEAERGACFELELPFAN